MAPGVRSDASRSREYTGGGFLSQCGRALYWRYGPHAARKPIDYLEGDTGVKMAEEMAEPWAGHLVPWECDNSHSLLGVTTLSSATTCPVLLPCDPVTAL